MTAARVATRMGLVAAVISLVLLAGLHEALADDEVSRARTEFVKNRNTCALLAALEGMPVSDERMVTDVLLAMMVCKETVPAISTASTGYDALPALVDALRTMNLAAATEASTRVGSTAGGGVGAWTRALVLARRGRDEEAIALVLAPPADPSLDVERVLFPLSIFGAALPRDDRLLLAATAREALLEACRRGHHGRVTSLARQTAALDPTLGPGVICLAARALRRSGRMQEAGSLLAGPETATSARARTCVQLERAIWQWRAGRGRQARALVQGLTVSPGVRFLIDAVAKATDAGQTLPSSRAVVEAGDACVEAATLARFATLLGTRTGARAVEAYALGQRRDAGAPAFAAEYLRSLGLEVEVSAGGVAAAKAAAERGLPFLLYRIRMRGDAFVDEPVVVRGLDPASGLWITDPCLLTDLDALPVGTLAKGRVLVAAPAELEPSPSAWASEREARLGRTLEAALELAHGGDSADAILHMEAQSANFGGEPVFDLYLAVLHHAVYREESDPTSLHLAEAAVGRSRLVEPQLAFEHYVHAENLRSYARSATEMDASVAAFETVQGLVPDSSHVAIIRSDVLRRADRTREALEALKLSRSLDPRDTTSLFLRGRLRFGLGDILGARCDLRRTFDRRPDSREAALGLAELEIVTGHPDAALDVLDEYTERVPDAAVDEEVLSRRRAAERALVRRATTVGALLPFLESPLEETRRRVVFALARLESEEAETALRGLLSDPHHAVRVTALQVYMRPWLRARVEAEDALGQRVVTLLRKDESFLVRGAAAGLLSLVDRPYAERELAARLVGPDMDPHRYPRIEVAGALARHDGVLARTTLVEALSDADLKVREAVIGALFKLAFTYHGYDPAASPAERAAAVERWRRWLREEQEADRDKEDKETPR